MRENDWCELVRELRAMREELAGIRRALEAANAADPVQAIAAALSDGPNEGSPAGIPNEGPLAAIQLGPHRDVALGEGPQPGEPDVPPEEQWRLR
jgi:hypothetical protein